MIEVLKQALEALEFFSDTSNSAMDKAMSEDAITSLKQAIAEAEKNHIEDNLTMAQEPASLKTMTEADFVEAHGGEQEPVTFPRQAGDSDWTIDSAFIWRVKHTIDPDTPYEFTPTEEQIEIVLLALEKIPSHIYTHPPQRQPLTVEQIDDIANEFSDEWGMIAPDSWEDFARAIEAAHGIKGEA